MVMSPTEEFCERLRNIVGLLERGEHREAAAAVAALKNLVATLPAEIPDRDREEAKQLLARYASLGEALRQDTLSGLSRLGAARRAAAYGRRRMLP